MRQQPLALCLKHLLDGIALILILGFVVCSVNFLTEITSNVATASMMLPILAALAVRAGVPVVDDHRRLAAQLRGHARREPGLLGRFRAR